jgi:hypothetical protein
MYIIRIEYGGMRAERSAPDIAGAQTQLADMFALTASRQPNATACVDASMRRAHACVPGSSNTRAEPNEQPTARLRVARCAQHQPHEGIGDKIMTSYIAISSVLAGLGCLLAAPILALRSVAPKRTERTDDTEAGL